MWAKRSGRESPVPGPAMAGSRVCAIADFSRAPRRGPGLRRGDTAGVSGCDPQRSLPSPWRSGAGSLPSAQARDRESRVFAHTRKGRWPANRGSGFGLVAEASLDAGLPASRGASAGRGGTPHPLKIFEEAKPTGPLKSRGRWRKWSKTKPNRSQPNPRGAAISRLESASPCPASQKEAKPNPTEPTPANPTGRSAPA